MESFNQEFSLFKATLKKFCPNTAILSELLELTQKKYIKLFTCLFFSQLPSQYEKSKVQDTPSLSTTCVIQDSDKPQGVFQFPQLMVSKAAPEGQIHRHKGTSRSQTCQCNKAQRQSNTSTLPFPDGSTHPSFQIFFLSGNKIYFRLQVLELGQCSEQKSNKC